MASSKDNNDKNEKQKKQNRPQIPHKRPPPIPKKKPPPLRKKKPQPQMQNNNVGLKKTGGGKMVMKIWGTNQNDQNRPPPLPKKKPPPQMPQIPQYSWPNEIPSDFKWQECGKIDTISIITSNDIMNGNKPHFKPYSASGLLFKINDARDMATGFCSGTLSKDGRSVITAAHCFVGIRSIKKGKLQDYHFMVEYLAHAKHINHIRFCPLYKGAWLIKYSDLLKIKNCIPVENHYFFTGYEKLIQEQIDLFKTEKKHRQWLHAYLEYKKSVSAKPDIRQYFDTNNQNHGKLLKRFYRINAELGQYDFAVFQLQSIVSDDVKGLEWKFVSDKQLKQLRGDPFPFDEDNIEPYIVDQKEDDYYTIFEKFKKLDHNQQSSKKAEEPSSLSSVKLFEPESESKENEIIKAELNIAGYPLESVLKDCQLEVHKFDVKFKRSDKKPSMTVNCLHYLQMNYENEMKKNLISSRSTVLSVPSSIPEGASGGGLVARIGKDNEEAVIIGVYTHGRAGTEINNFEYGQAFTIDLVTGMMLQAVLPADSEALGKKIMIYNSRLKQTDSHRIRCVKAGVEWNEKKIVKKSLPGFSKDHQSDKQPIVEEYEKAFKSDSAHVLWNNNMYHGYNEDYNNDDDYVSSSASLQSYRNEGGFLYDDVDMDYFGLESSAEYGDRAGEYINIKPVPSTEGVMSIIQILVLVLICCGFYVISLFVMGIFSFLMGCICKNNLFVDKKVSKNIGGSNDYIYDGLDAVNNNNDDDAMV